MFLESHANIYLEIIYSNFRYEVYNVLFISLHKSGNFSVNS